MILRTCLVQVCVVDAHAPHYWHIRIIILFLYEDWVRQLVRMQYFHNESSCKQPSNLITNSFPPIFDEAMEGLLRRFGIRPNMKRVLS